MPATPLPEGLNAVRVSSGTAVVAREDGHPVGEIALPPGWYFTEAGYTRLYSAVDVWQTRLESVERQLSALKAPAERPVRPQQSPHSGWAILSALALGFVLGFALGRRRVRR